ncbi:glycosyltransferase [Anaerovorax odorimutans]|uniref:glycosyltransferase n=1 Tax=Anaerovorax odorimutans TaxID=109327 RepID=UPI000419465A|nr:glycosyltransferase [Anaerovorax odorimutans]
MLKITLEATNCVYITKASPKKNYNSNTSVFTGRYKKINDIYRFFMNFDFNSIEEKLLNMSIEKAYLCFHLTRNEVPKNPGTSNIYVYRLIENFNSNTVNWENQPLPYNEVSAAFSIPYAKTGPIQIDITDLIKGWINKSIPNYGILIRGEENINSLIGFPGKNFHKKRLSPTLVIEYKYKNNIKSDNKIPFTEFYNTKSEYFSNYLGSGITEETKKLSETVQKCNYKGIIVYPTAVYWEPIQRPQQFLKELSTRGYLCFFCCPPNEKFFIKEIQENLYVVSNEDFLLQYIKDKYVIVLCTWLIQLAWADYIPNKLIWYDILDRIDFFSCYDEDMLKKHNELIEKADIVTYSAKLLKEYTNKRKDALYITNAVNPKDFVNISNTSIPNKIKDIVSSNKPIIGYFGAIEEWFDDELLLSIAIRQKNWQFIIIGNVSDEKRKLLNSPNINLLGPIKHEDLSNYAQYFDVCIIPFKVNKLTNSVSPVKLFEYASLGKPIVSSALTELKQYKSKCIYIANNSYDFEQKIEKCLEKSTQSTAAVEGVKFADKNTWEERTNQVEQAIKILPKGLLSYSNINNSQTIAALTASFFDFNGKNFYSGGAERYLFDLFKLFQKLGLRMQIYQYGNSTWVRRYENMDVISLSDGLESTPETFNDKFYNLTHYSTMLNIYSAFFEVYPKPSGINIGISHGVAWDSPYCVFNSGEKFWNSNQRFIESFRLCNAIVSVDTNTANWYQTIDYNVASKIKVIPNYVDDTEFSPRDNYEKAGEKTIIMYPRRLYAARGFYIFLEAIDDILEKYPNTEIHFVGKGFENDTNKVIEKIKQWGDRVRWYSLPLNEMPKAYKQADIVVIPTLYSEGTSLSCLEAMASGNAIIATRVGGLTDLIINNYNGISINPDQGELKNAIMNLLDNPQKVLKLKKNALEVSKVFSKSNWEKKWMQIIESMIDVKKEYHINESKLVEIYLQSISEFQDFKVKYLIYDLLCKNCLIYVIIKNNNEVLPNSYGRLQFLYGNEEILSKADFVYSYDKHLGIIDENKKNI